MLKMIKYLWNCKEGVHIVTRNLNIRLFNKGNVQEEIDEVHDSTMLYFFPIENMSYSHLTSQDKDVLDQVMAKFKEYKARDIIAYMHEETAYKQTVMEEIIPFNLAKEIRDFTI